MLSFLYVYSHHSILECYGLFSGVKLSMRSFCVIFVTYLSPEYGIKLSVLKEDHKIHHKDFNLVMDRLCIT